MYFLDIVNAALNKAFKAQAVALVDPATGAAATPGQQVLVATNGESFPADGPTAIAYNGDGTIQHVTITSGAASYRQTWTWTSGNVTAITGWVKQ